MYYEINVVVLQTWSKVELIEVGGLRCWRVVIYFGGIGGTYGRQQLIPGG